MLLLTPLAILVSAEYLLKGVTKGVHLRPIFRVRVFMASGKGCTSHSAVGVYLMLIIDDNKLVLVRNTTIVSMGKCRKDVTPVASFTKEVNRRLAKRPLVFNGRLANRRLTSLVKDALAMELRHSCTNPSIYWWTWCYVFLVCHCLIRRFVTDQDGAVATVVFELGQLWRDLMLYYSYMRTHARITYVIYRDYELCSWFYSISIYCFIYETWF